MDCVRVADGKCSFADVGSTITWKRADMRENYTFHNAISERVFKTYGKVRRLQATHMDYVETVERVAHSLLGYAREQSAWKPCRKTNGVAVYWRLSAEFPGNLYKGDGVVNGSPDKVWECLKPAPDGLRVKWDDNVKKFELIERVDDNVSVCRTVTPSAAMGIIAPRDFVDVVLVKKYEDGTITSNATHVEHPDCLPQQGYVRGFNHPCGCFCVPIPGEPGKTQVLSFFQTDLGGLLPRSVVDSFFPSSMTQFYCNLAKAVKSL